MSLSIFCKKVIRAGLANRVAANELIAAVDGFPAGAVQATNVSTVGALPTVSLPIGAMAPVAGTVGDPTAALASSVDSRLATIQTAFDAEITSINNRVSTLQLRIDAILNALTTSQQMAPEA